MKKKLLCFTFTAMVATFVLAHLTTSCKKADNQTSSQTVENFKEGVDYEIVPDSLPFTNSEGQPDFWYPSNAGDTIWLRGPKVRGASGGSKHYESDPMWREVQRHVDNDPYFKQW